jgi:homocysteine S-methyltransferase
MMHDPIHNFLSQGGVLILDGALATELECRGADIKHALWSAKCLIEHPELIREVHLDYFRAGADVATSATYQATFEGFARRGIGGAQATQLMREAVALALDAREEFWSVAANRTHRRRPLVAASIGPYGAMLADGSEYRGCYALDDTGLADFHRPRLRVLADAGADILACETIPCLREARVLARLLSEEFPGVCAWMSFSCRDGEHNAQGEDIGACVAALESCPQIAAVGVNCTAPQYITSLLRRMRRSTGKPLLVYPNSGEVFDAASKRWHASMQPGAVPSFGVMAQEWLMEGARLIGGCCRTAPKDIRDVKRCTDSALSA